MDGWAGVAKAGDCGCATRSNWVLTTDLRQIGHTLKLDRAKRTRGLADINKKTKSAAVPIQRVFHALATAIVGAGRNHRFRYHFQADSTLGKVVSVRTLISVEELAEIIRHGGDIVFFQLGLLWPSFQVSGSRENNRTLPAVPRSSRP